MNKQIVIQLVLMVGAASLFYAFGHPVPAAIIGSLAVLFTLMAIVAPGPLHTLRAAIDRLFVWIGTGLGVVLLTLIYYTIFVPASFWLRIRGKDELKRVFPTGGVTNWIDRVGHGDDKNMYKKLYTRPHAATSKPAAPAAPTARLDGRGGRAAEGASELT
jgi:hypothetical protein